MEKSVRPSSSVKVKVLRGAVHGLATVIGMYLAGQFQKNPQYGALAPVILGPLGGWLRNKFPAYADTVPF